MYNHLKCYLDSKSTRADRPYTQKLAIAKLAKRSSNCLTSKRSSHSPSN